MARKSTEITGAVLRRWRESAGLSLTQAAALAALSISKLSRFECGKGKLNPKELESLLVCIYTFLAFKDGYLLKESSTGQDLVLLRRACGWAQKDLADAIQTPVNTVVAIENGRMPLTPELIAKVNSAAKPQLELLSPVRDQVAKRLPTEAINHVKEQASKLLRADIPALWRRQSDVAEAHLLPQANPEVTRLSEECDELRKQLIEAKEELIKAYRTIVSLQKGEDVN